MGIAYKQLELGLGDIEVNPKRNKSNRPRSKADFYQTPAELAYATIDRLISSGFILPSKVKDILDPGCGNGIWTSNYITHIKDTDLDPNFYGIDIDVPQFNKFLYGDLVIDDYITHDYASKRFDLILGNPPFSLMEEFIRKSYSLLNQNGVIAFLGRLEFLGSQKRCKGLFREIPLQEVWVSSRRPSFFSVLDGKHTTDMMEYAIFIVIKERMLVGLYRKPTLDWLMWEYENE